MNEYNEFERYQQQMMGGASVTPVKKHKSSAKRIIALAVCCSMLGGAVGAGGMFAGMRYLNADQQYTDVVRDTAPETLPIDIPAVSGSRNVITETAASSGKLMTASEVYSQNVNSTVGITTSISSTNYFGYRTTAAAAGSGFIVTANGYILTNHHVIDGADSITVTTYDGTTYDAELIGSDQSNDIAVLKIDAEGLAPVTLGSSDELRVGEDVVAIGNPLGELTFSLTAGVVSALDREVTTGNATMNLIQTDCAINSGNSGGALFNMYGEVVGITNAKYSSNSAYEASIDNIGFAIPIDTVKKIVSGIIENGYYAKPYIGVSVTDVSAEAISYGLPAGAAVLAVNDNSPAQKAGLEESDIITNVNGEEITKANDLTAVVKRASAGDKLTLKVYSKGEYKQLEIVVEESKPTKTDADNSPESYQNGYGYNGFDPFGDMGRMFGS